MEQHPVPRNISSFQFHLIGDMTLRQFAYLAAGVGGGFAFFKLAPLPSTISLSIALIIGFIGVAFAFLPIQERPLDKWLVAFIKSILSPTQYLWHKKNIPPEILTRAAVVHVPIHPQAYIEAHYEAREKLRAYLATIPSLPHETLNVQEKNYIEKTLALFGTSSMVTTPPLPTVQTISSPQLSSFKATPTTPTIKKAQISVKESFLSSSPPPPSLKKEEATLQQQLSGVTAEKETLLKELAYLKQEFKKIKEPTIVKPEQTVETKEQPTIKTITPKTAAEELDMPRVPQAPNLIVGVIKDPQKKLLPNIIITIKDKSGLPLRALKTNKLGQFATATPLSNGTYLLEVEDPLKRFIFDMAEFALSGKVFLPIEIIAKGEKELIRERLTKELFGSANI